MIIFAHLLNDRSGSPRVLKSVIQGLSREEAPSLYIGSQGEGVLSTVSVPTRKYWYRRTRNKLLTLVTYFLSQWCLFWSLLSARGIPRDAVLYANTLLPFGASLYGRLTGRPVIYHVHEVSLTPSGFRFLLVAIARLTADRLIYVSDAHRALLPIAPKKSVTIYNTIDPDLAVAAQDFEYTHRPDGAFIVLLLASDRVYKGIPEFLMLARSMARRPDIVFHLVLSDGVSDDSRPIPPNVTILPPTDKPAQYYQQASLVLNLSRPDMWIETFGLTLLEAMAFGVPVIAPPVGGPTELVSEGVDGFLIDSRDHAALATAVERLADDAALCRRMSGAARAAAGRFGPDQFHRSVASAIHAARIVGAARSAR